jgi:hypothetical protein
MALSVKNTAAIERTAVWVSLSAQYHDIAERIVPNAQKIPSSVDHVPVHGKDIDDVVRIRSRYVKAMVVSRPERR